jgi:hypothetical protein
MYSIKTLNNHYSAGKYFYIKGSDIEFFMLKIDFEANKIEYRRYGYNEIFKGTVDDIRMPDGVKECWRYFKINTILNVLEE